MAVSAIALARMRLILACVALAAVVLVDACLELSCFALGASAIENVTARRAVHTVARACSTAAISCSTTNKVRATLAATVAELVLVVPC